MSGDHNMNQKPVAYLDEGLGFFYWPKEYKKDVGFTPLYKKRMWVGLTHDEVDSWELPDCPTVFEFVQFIESKVKEKNT